MKCFCLTLTVLIFRPWLYCCQKTGHKSVKIAEGNNQSHLHVIWQFFTKTHETAAWCYHCPNEWVKEKESTRLPFLSLLCLLGKLCKVSCMHLSFPHSPLPSAYLHALSPSLSLYKTNKHTFSVIAHHHTTSKQT